MTVYGKNIPSEPAEKYYAEAEMPTGREIWETGQEPDYTIDDIARVETLTDGTVRLYVASEWRGGLKVEYSIRVNKARLAELGRLCLVIAAEGAACDQILTCMAGMH